jgi:FkbM family methyltransferase
MLDRTRAYGLDFLFPEGDSAIGESLALYGEFAAVISDFLIEHATAETGTLIDAGANIGSVSLPFAAARPNWRVLGVEAHRGIAAIYGANAMNNRLTNVEIIQAAIAAERGLVRFPNPPLGLKRNFGTLSLNTTDFETAPILRMTLDDIAPADTRLIKIDIEGHDAEALKGAPRLMQETRPIWLVEAAVNHPETAREVVRLLLEADYRVHWFFAPFATSRALKGRKTPTLGKGDANVVALPAGVENSWNLPEIHSPDTPRPGAASDYPYLARYGMS